MTLFGAACPLLPLLAFVNNVIEIRLDADKLVNEVRRPNPVLSDGIGPWASIMFMLTLAGGITNVALVVFISQNGQKWLPTESSRILAFFVAEHAFLLTIICIDSLVFVSLQFWRSSFGLLLPHELKQRLSLRPLANVDGGVHSVSAV
eukprot:SAG11_NODE_3643_length_2316_cov_2.335589_2_plen_148_part_00